MMIATTKKGGKKIEREKTIVTTAKAKKQQQDEPPHRPSKYVGVSWNKLKKKWNAYIYINRITKSLGSYDDEKEAARIYDEHAALLGKPVNFPLHEGMEQAVKQARKRKDRSKMPDVNKRSKYVGLFWHKPMRKWQVSIVIDGKRKFLGYYHDEKEATHVYDEQAALLGRPMNFPLHQDQEQAVKEVYRQDVRNLPDANRPSKYVGVSWNKQKKKWQASLYMGRKNKRLGLHQDEKEAARIYDEQAVLLGKPVNFPLHEGMEQAVKRARM